ncbi:hypothetical protein WJX73_007751 [Symbiochloris irregularis]|uniref:Methyltransferase n=1 Tax=Symbiochloris irregularis TaxID=706552 RepID=A0AAW1NQY9_9CHLO
MSFLKSWTWKREHRSDRARFHEPFVYTLHERQPNARQLSISQAPFDAEGFASTVWDSSIVMAKYFERWPDLVCGKRCLDLSAGCGLAL